MSDNAIYYVASVEETDFGTYYAKVTSECGEAISDNIIIKLVSIIDNTDPYFRIISVVPNPIHNGDATINFVLSQFGDVTFSLIDVSGRNLGVLHTGHYSEGDHSLFINDKLSSVSSGSYFLLLESRGRKAAMKININR